MKKIIPLLALAVCGCGTSPKYIEGTSLSLGAYIPWDGTMYGVEIMQFVNGSVVRVPTNTAYQIQREHSATNSWLWGALNTIEHTMTTVDLK